MATEMRPSLATEQLTRIASDISVLEADGTGGAPTKPVKPARRRRWLGSPVLSRAQRRILPPALSGESDLWPSALTLGRSLAETARQAWHKSWAPAFVLVAFAMPLLASIATVLAYALIAPSGTAAPPVTPAVLVANDAMAGVNAILLGLLSAIVVWITMAILCRPLATVKGVNPRIYEELLSRLHRLDAVLAPWHARVRSLPGDQLADGPDWLTAYREACAHREALASGLGVSDLPEIPGALGEPSTGPAEKLSGQTDTDLRWVLGSGYISMWKRVHRAEEALMELDGPVTDLVSGALHDELRLKSSRVEHWREWQSRLRVAIEVLSADARRYSEHWRDPEGEGAVCQPVDHQSALEALRSPSVAAERLASRTGTVELQLRTGQQALAKAMLRHIRRTLNECHDGRRDALLRLRNHTLKAIALIGAGTYALIVLSILMSVSRDALVATAALYFVGGTVGLMTRVYLDSRMNAATEDFGLREAQLFETPCLSGLASVVGAVGVALIVAAWDSSGTTHGGTLAVTSNSSAGYAPYLFVAAICGLLPAVLMSHLQQPASHLKSGHDTVTPAEKG
jgi:hypothetical protein